MRRRRQGLQVSTFPFLAVLLCTMGSLILVLLAMDRKSKLAALYRSQQVAARVAEEATQAAAARRADWERRHQQVRADWERARLELRARLTGEKEALLTQMGSVQRQASDAARGLQT